MLKWCKHASIKTRRAKARSYCAFASLLWAASIHGKARADDDTSSSARGLTLQEAHGYEKSYAVVIGIDKYQAPGVHPLGGAVRDARSVASTLSKRGFEVTTLYDAAATREAIARVLADEMPNKLNSGDRVLVFFAGHGVSTGPKGREMGYLVPVKGRKDALRSTGISMSELQGWLNGYPAKHVMFVADACYSGLAVSTRAMALSPESKDYLEKATQEPVRFTLVAGHDQQEAHEDPESGHGVFTRFFLEGINGNADLNRDGLITSDEIAAYVKPEVTNYVSARMRATQTPQSGRSGQGEFIFFTPDGPSLAAPSSAPPAAPPVAAAPGAFEAANAKPTEEAAPPPPRQNSTRSPQFYSDDYSDTGSESSSNINWAGGLTLLSLAGGGAALVVYTKGRADKYEKRLDEVCVKEKCPESAQKDIERFESAQMLNYLGWAATLGLGAVGFYTLFSGSKSGSSATEVRPYFTGNSGGVRGSF